MPQIYQIIFHQNTVSVRVSSDNYLMFDVCPEMVYNMSLYYGHMTECCAAVFKAWWKVPLLTLSLSLNINFKIVQLCLEPVVVWFIFSV